MISEYNQITVSEKGGGMKLKNIKSVVLELCKLEAGKKQVDVAQMTEIVSKLSRMVFESEKDYLSNTNDWAKYSVFLHLMRHGRKVWLKEQKAKK